MHQLWLKHESRLSGEGVVKTMLGEERGEEEEGHREEKRGGKGGVKGKRGRREGTGTSVIRAGAGRIGGTLLGKLSASTPLVRDRYLTCQVLRASSQHAHETSALRSCESARSVRGWPFPSPRPKQSRGNCVGSPSRPSKAVSWSHPTIPLPYQPKPTPRPSRLRT